MKAVTLPLEPAC